LREPGAAGQPAIIAAALMLGFSAILVWAQRSPRYRRGVLAVTLLVIAGLASANVASGVSGDIPWSELAPTLAIQAVLLAMFSVSAWMKRGRTLEHLTPWRRQAANAGASGDCR
jgi:CHASE2 domain-containing sensor protein